MNKDKPRRDIRVLRSRRMLKNAFIDLLNEMELEKISVNLISKHAGLNRVTFYLHYRDMKDMLEKIADEMIEDLRTVMNQEPTNSSSIEEREYISLINMLKYIAAHAKFYKAVLGSRRTTIFTQRLQLLMSEMIFHKLDSERESNLTISHIQNDFVSWYGSSTLLGTIMEWLQLDMPYTPEFLAKQFLLLRSQSIL
jgi:AcrR family transcriptional regulator